MIDHLVIRAQELLAMVVPNMNVSEVLVIVSNFYFCRLDNPCMAYVCFGWIYPSARHCQHGVGLTGPRHSRGACKKARTERAASCDDNDDNSGNDGADAAGVNMMLTCPVLAMLIVMVMRMLVATTMAMVGLNATAINMVMMMMTMMMLMHMVMMVRMMMMMMIRMMVHI